MGDHNWHGAVDLSAATTLVTFIVPTVGRVPLDAALDSLAAQTDAGWRAVVVGDNVDPVVPARFGNLSIEAFRTDFGGSAGATRNAGFDRAGTPWIAFLDDDDRVAPEYVERLREIDELHPNADLGAVVFCMDDPKLGILPDPFDPQLLPSMVGISFAVASEVIWRFHLQFIEEQVEKRWHEDFQLLTDIRRVADVLVVPEVMYLVKGA